MDDPESATKAIITTIGRVKESFASAARRVEILEEPGHGPLKDRQMWVIRRLREKLNEASSTSTWLEKIARADAPHPQLRALDLGEEASRAVRRAAAMAERVGATILIRAAGHDRACADPEVVGRVLDNLLDNAITYSEGRPWVVVETGSHPTPFIRVWDAGIGLTPEASRRIFERSYRADPGNQDRPGSGIGLYFSRRAAEEIGGSLVLESTKVGSGSAFRLDLPAADGGSGRGPSAT